MTFPLSIQFFDAGHCLHPQFVVLRNRSIRPMRFHCMFALIVHPKHGAILFDTGYSMKFLEVTRSFPERIYALTTPVRLTPEQCAISKLRNIGIQAHDVRHIILSHFHADHIAALDDFPKAKLWFHPSAWKDVQNIGRWKGVFRGFLRQLLPADFMERSSPLHNGQKCSLPAHYAPFREGFDLFGDSSLLLVSLPGHAKGQIGCFLHSQKGREIFLVADACWTSRSLRECITPHPITKILFSDYNIYQQTLFDLHNLSQRESSLLIAPSHCPEIHRHFCNRGPF